MIKTTLKLLVVVVIWCCLEQLVLSGTPETEKKEPVPLSEIAGVYSLSQVNMPIQEKELSLEYLNGVSLRSLWNILEPEAEKPNWQYIDDSIKVVEKNKKKIMLRIIAGEGTPTWVYKAGAKEFKYEDENPNHPTFGQEKVMPVPWDEIYLSKWNNFIKALGKRYNDNKIFSIIQMNGPSRGGEMHLESKKDKERWLEIGFSREKLVNAWKETINAYAEAFPDKYLAIDIAKPVSFNESMEIVKDVLAYGYQKLGKRFCVQGNWLAAKTRDDFDLYKLVKEYSAKTVVGFQMLWSVTTAADNQSDKSKEGGQKPNKENRMGGTLREAIDKGLVAGAIYLEIYRGDIRNPKLQDDISYASERLKHNTKPKEEKK